jgi:ribosomal RNA-processing protein 8
MTKHKKGNANGNKSSPGGLSSMFDQKVNSTKGNKSGSFQPYQQQKEKIKFSSNTKNALVKPSSSSSSSKKEGNVSASSSLTSKPGKEGLSSLQQQFQKKLEGARFRSINEELYTSVSSSAFQDFQQNPSKFFDYHKGYREQVASGWPCNPLDHIITWIQLTQPSSSIVADMGCGEARLASSVSNKVHSYDLVACNESVIACDIANVPLQDASVDIVVFCLSLMGTNINSFLSESNRILKKNGILKIVEVRSRFEDKQGIKAFQSYLKHLGFKVVPSSSSSSCSSSLAPSSSSSSQQQQQKKQKKVQEDNGADDDEGSDSDNDSERGDEKADKASAPQKPQQLNQSTQVLTLLDNKMFFTVECRKVGNVRRVEENFSLKPCQYKKR